MGVVCVYVQVESLRPVGLVSQLGFVGLVRLGHSGQMGLVGLARLLWSDWVIQDSWVGQSLGFDWIGLLVLVRLGWSVTWFGWIG